jgi:hypothetical protein
MQRNRIEIFYVDGEEITDAERLLELQQRAGKSVWSKSIVVDDLINNAGLDRSIARAIAAMVEEKILGMKVGRVSSSLVKQLVLNDTAAVLYAQKQLQLA